jgi:hypothetical protein
LFAALLAALAVFAVAEIFFPARVPANLRGRWVVVEGEGIRGSTLDFHRDGTLFMTTVGLDGKEVTMKNSVEIRDNQIRVTTTGPGIDVAVTEAQDILELTDELFVTQNSRGEVLILERVGRSSGNTSTGSGKWPRRNTNAK